MSGVVVGIGYILLIPSILGILFSLYMVFATADASTKGHSSAGMAVAGFAELLEIGFGIASLVGGLLGWLLIMKKNVLQCHHCGAVVAAS
jgi:hypothetical protein